MEEKCKHYNTRFYNTRLCGKALECNRKTCKGFEINVEAEETAKKTVEKPYKIIRGVVSDCERELNELAKKFKVDIIGIKNRDHGRLLLVVRKTPL